MSLADLNRSHAIVRLLPRKIDLGEQARCIFVRHR